MPSHRQPRPRLISLLVALGVVPPIVFVGSLLWLKQLPDSLVFAFTGITATLVIVASFALAILQDRRLDEWNRSNSRFSSQWGWTAGASLVALLLAFPPIHELIMHWATTWGGAPNPDRRLVLVTFTFGFLTVVIAQLVCTALLSIGWAFWKSRAARDPA